MSGARIIWIMYENLGTQTNHNSLSTMCLFMFFHSEYQFLHLFYFFPKYQISGMF